MSKCVNCPGRFLIDSGRWVLFDSESTSRWMSYRQCSRCWAYQPLGPSDEEPVAYEIRAAEIAAMATSNIDEPPGLTVGEINGWEIHRLDKVGGIDEWRAAGYLARCIHEHTESDR